jgi:4-hydroxy-tetrahydrodipicolinate synthase
VPTVKTIQNAAALAGVFPALFTPLLDDDPKRLKNGIDYAKAKRMIDDLVAAGVDGLVPVGTTGQSPTVTPQQHKDFIRFTADYLDGRLPIVAGAGSNCTRESVDMIQELQRHLGTLAVLCVTGYYNNPPQQGLLQHFRVLSRETGAKIVLYNVPGRSASYLEPDTLVELADDPNVIGVKQAVDFRSPGKHRDDTLDVIRRTKPDQFAVVSGEDDALPAVLEMGGTGIVSATANVPEAARLYGDIVRAHRAGDAAAVAAAQEKVMPFVQAVFCRKNPIPLGVFFNSPLYLPLVSVEETADGAAAKAAILELVRGSAPSLAKYHT